MPAPVPDPKHPFGPNGFAKNIARADATPGLKGIANGARFSDFGKGWASFTHSLAISIPTSLLRAGQFEHAARRNIARAGRRH